MLSLVSVDLDNNPTVPVVRKHFVEHLGPPAEVFEMEGSPVPGSPLRRLNVAYFAPGGPDAPIVVATSGASVFRMNDGRRIEALMVLRRRPSDSVLIAVRRLLASFALFSEANDAAVRFGDVVRAKDELAPASPMDAILFVPPFTFLPSFHRVGLSESEAVDLVWLLPVFAAEADYALRYGPQALLTLFAGQQLDLTDLHRTPGDVTMTPEAAAEQAQRAIDAAPRPQPTAGQSRPSRPSAPTPATAGPEEETAAVRTQRRRPKASSPTASAPPDRAAAGAAGSKRPVVRPSPAARRAREQGVRFDLAKDGLPGASPRPRAGDRRPAAPTPAAAPAPSPRKLTKAERVAALKQAAQEARQRAQKRRKQSGARISAPTGANPHPPPALRSTPVRPTEAAATSGPVGSERLAAAKGSPSAAARRRGAPFRGGPTTGRGGGTSTDGPDDNDG